MACRCPHGTRRIDGRLGVDVPQGFQGDSAYPRITAACHRFRQGLHGL